MKKSVGRVSLFIVLWVLSALSGCDNPAQSGSSGNGEVDLTIANEYGHTIDVHFGDWNERNIHASAQEISNGTEQLFPDAPAGRSVELWFTYNDGNNRTVIVVDDLGDPYQFEFDTTSVFQLKFTPAVVEYYIDGTDQFGDSDGSGDGGNTSPAPTVYEPYFSPTSTNHWDYVDVTLDSSTSGATIYYTIDGSEPTTDSTSYTGPFRLEISATVKAIAEKDGSVSDVASRSYTVYPDQGTFGVIEKIVAIDNSTFYAIDPDNAQLHKFDAQLNQVVASFPLEHSGPVDMEYAADGDKGLLYILSKSQSTISRFNVSTEEFEDPLTVDVASVADFAMTGIEIDATNKRIYVVMEDKDGWNAHHLRILDLNGASIAAPETVIKGPLLRYDAVNQHLFAANTGTSPATIERYDVSQDTLGSVSSSSTLGSNGQHIAVSADGAHLAFLAGSGNGEGYTVYDIDPMSFPANNGEWNTGAYPRYGLFSPDSQYFYALSDFMYDQMKIFRVDNHTLLRERELPYSGRYVRAAISPDGSTMVAFTYDSYDDTRHYFYVITDLAD